MHAERSDARADWQFDLASLLFLVTVVSVSLAVGRNFNFAWATCVLFYGTATFFAVRDWAGFLDSFTVWQGFAFFVLWLGFSLLSCLILSQYERLSVMRVLVSSVACVMGPFVGAISGSIGSNSIQNSVLAFPYFAIGLGFSLLLHAVIRQNRWIDAVRLFFWTTGLVLWFLGGISSFMMGL